MKTSAIVTAVMLGTATSSTQRVNRSTITVMYRFPQAVFGSGPNMSMPTVWKGTGELNNRSSPAALFFVDFLFWQNSHDRTNSLMSRDMPLQMRRNFGSDFPVSEMARNG